MRIDSHEWIPRQSWRKLTELGYLSIPEWKDRIIKLDHKSLEELKGASSFPVKKKDVTDGAAEDAMSYVLFTFEDFHASFNRNKFSFKTKTNKEPLFDFWKEEGENCVI